MEDIFGKYRKQLVRAGVLRSAVLGLALAFTAVGAAAFAAWIARASLPVILGLTISAGGLVFLVSFPFFYIKCFRPTDGDIARRLDALGLDERAVTMYRFREDRSGMAALQRADARAELAAVSKVGYPAALRAALLLAFGALFAAGAVAGAVISARSAGVAAGETEPEAPPVQTFTVTYGVFGEGSIEGELVQEVEAGGYTEAVTAVPASGYRFSAWVDENKTPLLNQNNPRSEVNVRGDMFVYALFEEVSPAAPGDESGNQQGDTGPDNELEQGGDTDDPDDSGGSGDNQQGEGGSPELGGDGRTNNKVIDGTQDYKEDFDREKYEDELVEKDIPDDLKDILGDYYDTLKP